MHSPRAGRMVRKATVLILLFGLGAVSVVVGNDATLRGKASNNSVGRHVELRRVRDSTVILMEVEPDESAFMSYTDGSGRPVHPFFGIDFDADTEGLFLRLKIADPDPQRDRTWSMTMGISENKERYAALGGQIHPSPKDETPVPVHHIVLPVQIEGVECHLFPFMVVDNRMGSMLVVIADNREAIRNALQVRPRKNSNFSWKTAFLSPERFSWEE